MDGILNVYVANLGKYNEGELKGEWIGLPIDGAELGRILTEEVGIELDSQKAYEAGMRGESVYEEYAIHDYDCEINGLTDSLGEYESLSELNYLAAKLDNLQDWEMKQFEAVLELGEHTASVKDLINLTENLDCYSFAPDISDDDDLGRYYIDSMGYITDGAGEAYFDFEAFGRDVDLEYYAEDEEMPETAGEYWCGNEDATHEDIGRAFVEDLGFTEEQKQTYFDYESFGRDIRIEEGGMFTEDGYVCDTGDSFVEVYTDRDDIPEEFQVQAPEGEEESLLSTVYSKEEIAEFREKHAQHGASLEDEGHDAQAAAKALSNDSGDEPNIGQER